jgi:ribosome-associated protein
MSTYFGVRGEYITLGQLLKATGHARTGGDTKDMLASGEIRVNGAQEDRRGAKLRPGMTIVFPGGETFLLVSEEEAAAHETEDGSPGVPLEVATEPDPNQPVVGKERRFEEGKPRKRNLDASGQPKKTHTQTGKYATYGEYQKERRALRKEGREIRAQTQKPGAKDIAPGPRRGASRPR